MRKTLILLAILGCLALVAGPAQATMVAISVNFTNASNLLAPTDVAGYAANGTAYANWNNMTSGNSFSNAKYSNGNASTGTFLTTSLDSWNTNIDIQNSWGTPNSGSTANDKLMRAGGWTGGTGAGAPANSNHRITLSNLNTLFPNGYVIYLYQDSAYNNQVAQWGGDSVVNTPPVGTTFVWSGGISNGNDNFSNFAVNNHQVKLSNTGGANLTMDTLTINQNCVAYSTGPVSATLITGIQVVGDVSFAPPVAEPAGLGLVGVALLALRKRRS